MTKVEVSGDRLDFEPGIAIEPDEIKRWFDGIRNGVMYFRPDGVDVVFQITPDQIRALRHALSDPNCCAMSFGGLGERIAKETEAGIAEGEFSHGPLIIEAAIPSEKALLIDYKWNADAEGHGAWLEADGGWHYQPGERGSYPWKENIDA